MPTKAQQQEKRQQAEREELARELAFMSDQDRWPQWPILPVKSYKDRKPGDFPTCGFIVATKGPVVYLGSMYMIKPGSLDSMEKQTFASFEALQEAGWRVD